MKKILFVYPRFCRHAQHHPELLDVVPMNEYLGSPSLGIAALCAITPEHYTLEYRDDRVESAMYATDADLVALSFFTPAAARGMELADYFRAQGKAVVAGGIFPTMMPEVVAEHVDAVVIGEGEGSWLRLLRDYEAGALQPYYRPEAMICLDDVPQPDLSLYLGAERLGFQPDDYPVQLSRGCALNCVACALPTSMTRERRNFSLEHVMGQLQQLRAVGKRACLTEDTSWFPGKKGLKHLVQLFEHLEATGQTADVSYIGISMPMVLTTPLRHFELARRAGIKMFYLVGGFDPITTRAFTGQDPKALARAEEAIARCHDVGITPYTSFLIGGDQDDLGTVDRILEFTQKTKLEKAEFAIFTPYPGTPSYQRLEAEGRILSRDWSRYNDANVVFQPAQMTPDELLQGYLRLWREFYAERSDLSHLSLAERTIQF